MAFEFCGGHWGLSVTQGDKVDATTTEFWSEWFTRYSVEYFGEMVGVSVGD